MGIDLLDIKLLYYVGILFVPLDSRVNVWACINLDVIFIPFAVLLFLTKLGTSQALGAWNLYCTG